MPFDSGMDEFARLVKAIEPLLDHVVIVGGWAHRLYRFHRKAQVPKHAPLMTLDADVAVPEKLPGSGKDIRQRLLEAGFRESLLSDHNPPVSQYTLGDEHGGFYVEFLAPLTGSRYKRGKPDSTMRVAGVTAQKLRHLEILLLAPWSVELEEVETNVRIANPASYVAQKLLIHNQREAADRAKDILYIHDTIEIFAASLPEIRSEWKKQISPALHRNIARDIGTASTQAFQKVTDDIRSAAEIAKSLGRPLSPERLLQVSKAGITEILGIETE